MKVERFEDLLCWQAARELVNLVYKAVRESDSFKRELENAGNEDQR